ncbi:hypothetical protein ACFQH2_13730 [Natronoarchaeum sp. GCM10025703]|uniref:hypothetical protein n=1 Tax=Natronoarchaeum sp. GCM10025703 TaxID=3252685 RepID=UPI003611B43B
MSGCTSDEGTDPGQENGEENGEEENGVEENGEEEEELPEGVSEEEFRNRARTRRVHVGHVARGRDAESRRTADES